MGLCALTDELTVLRSPDPLGAVAAAPGFVAGILTTGMVAGIDRQHGDSPTSARIVLDLLKWGKNPEGDCTVTVQFWSGF